MKMRNKMIGEKKEFSGFSTISISVLRHALWSSRPAPRSILATKSTPECGHALSF